jgi:hypothetical protein
MISARLTDGLTGQNHRLRAVEKAEAALRKVMLGPMRVK